MAHLPQDVYARQLVSRRGYPLWTPEPNMNLPDVYVREGLKVGDVGVVVPEDGSFDVFFNVCLPPSHSLHRESGVPDNFTPILLSGRDIAKFPEAECAGRIISTSSVTRVRNMDQSDEHAARRTRSTPLNYEFTLSSHEGTVLILPEGAERYYLRNERPFLDEAIHHAVDWYTFAEQRLGRIINHDSLYLITGFYKSRSWSLTACQRSTGTGDNSAQFKAVGVGGGNITANYTWETTRAMDWRAGPSDQYYNGIPNQTVFIHGFKIAIREGILGRKRVNVKVDIPSARPYRVNVSSSSRFLSLRHRGSGSHSGLTTNAPNGPVTGTNLNVNPMENLSGDESDEAREDVTIIRFPQLPDLKPFHPSDIINKYLLREVPSASVAITHDEQWIGLLEKGLLKSGEVSEEDRLVRAISANCTLTTCKGAVYLAPSTAPGPTSSDRAVPSPSTTQLTLQGTTSEAPLGLERHNDGYVGSDHSSTDCDSCKVQNLICDGACPLCCNCIHQSNACVYDLDANGKERDPPSHSLFVDSTLAAYDEDFAFPRREDEMVWNAYAPYSERGESITGLNTLVGEEKGSPSRTLPPMTEIRSTVSTPAIDIRRYPFPWRDHEMIWDAYALGPDKEQTQQHATPIKMFVGPEARYSEIPSRDSKRPLRDSHRDRREETKNILDNMSDVYDPFRAGLGGR